MLAALETLSSDDRELLLLVGWDGLDAASVAEALAALRPDDGGLRGAWSAERRQAVLRRVLTEAKPPRPSVGAGRWIGGLAVAAAAVIALLLLPGLLGWGRLIDAVPAQTTRGPVAEPTWVRIADGPLPARYEARGTWLDGRYLLVGGHGDPCGPVESGCQYTGVLLADGALYDPAVDEWTTIAPVPLVRHLGEPVVVGDSAYFMTGTLFIGDEEPNSRADFLPGGEQILLRYQVNTDTWTSHPLPHPAGGQLVATDDAVIVLSGSDLNVEIADLVFHPDDDTWTELPDDPLGPSGLRYAVWAEDRLVLSALPLDAADARSGPAQAGGPGRRPRQLDPARPGRTGIRVASARRRRTRRLAAGPRARRGRRRPADLRAALRPRPGHRRGDHRPGPLQGLRRLPGRKPRRDSGWPPRAGP